MSVEQIYTTVFDQNALDMSHTTIEALNHIDPDDRTENLAQFVADDQGDLDVDAVANTLLALSHTNWGEMPDETKATMIDFCGRILDSMGLSVTGAKK